jgi:hypothetical protein
MRNYTDQRRVTRNSRLSKVLIIVGLGGMVVAFLVSLGRSLYINQVLVFALFGTVISQIGMALYNRWGRRPRVDEVLDHMLKGLDERYAIFHYSLGTAHVLICPAGAYALLPNFDEGDVTYSEGKIWVDPGKGGVLRRSRRKQLKSLDNDERSAEDALEKALKSAAPGESEKSIGSIHVFMRENSQVKVKDAPYLTTHMKKLKNLIRRLPKGKSFTKEEIESLVQILGF